MTTIYLIRHSVKFPLKAIDKYYGSNDKHLRDEKTILSVEGEKRAEILSNEKELDNIDIVYSSNMVRAIATAKYLCEKQNLQLNIDDRFNERMSGKPNDDIYPDWFQRQYLDLDFKTEGGESQREVSERFYEALMEVLNENQGKRIVIFAHGYSITYTLLKWCKLENVTSDRRLTLSFNDKIIMDKIINAPEVFKIEFYKNKKIKSIELIEFDDLPYRFGQI